MFVMDDQELDRIISMILPDEETLKRADSDMGMVMLTTGIKSDDTPFYAYIMVPPSKYHAFIKAHRQGNYCLNDFGLILKTEDKEEPPEDVKAFMEEYYGVNHHIVEDMQKVISDIQEARKQGTDESQQKRIMEKYGVKPKGDN